MPDRSGPGGGLGGGGGMAAGGTGAGGGGPEAQVAVLGAAPEVVVGVALRHRVDGGTGGKGGTAARVGRWQGRTAAPLAVADARWRWHNILMLLQQFAVQPRADNRSPFQRLLRPTNKFWLR